MLSGMAGLTLKLMQFGPIGWTELLIIIVIALLLFGPRRLPELARSMGEAINEFRKASSGVTSKEEKEEKTKKSSSEIRELALSLGIEVAGKTDEELMEEIKALAAKKKGSEE
ncbi:MAG: twin-arginine translocase TatA/TatE family subunit [Candidatus Korarchaeota archaeon]|nr:twin-arginine translocase TatA/TatE family subunit [Candidatus Korarchaeota archaeon]